MPTDGGTGMFRALTALAYRVYSDFLMPSRIPSWSALLEMALKHGYLSYSVGGFLNLVRTQSVDPESRYLIVRHDVDTDRQTAGEMWGVERRLGVLGSYFFRLTTVDPEMMKRIHETGSEASYHYEELACVTKKMRLHSKEQVLSVMPIIRRLFSANLCSLRSLTGLPMDIVASHGDWANRHIGLPNTVILADPGFWREMHIKLEVYDEEFMTHVTSRLVDMNYPRFWSTGDPTDAIRRGEKVVYLLVHPRHWRANLALNLQDDLGRSLEGLTYRFGMGKHTLAEWPTLEDSVRVNKQ